MAVVTTLCMPPLLRWALAHVPLREEEKKRMEAEDIADAISYIVTRPRHVAINELLIRPTDQER